MSSGQGSGRVGSGRAVSPRLRFHVTVVTVPSHTLLFCSNLHLPPSLPLSLCFSPEMADKSSFDVQLGDIILTATDGLFDNMPDYMILQELKKLKASSLSLTRAMQTRHLCLLQNFISALLSRLTITSAPVFDDRTRIMTASSRRRAV